MVSENPGAAFTLTGVARVSRGFMMRVAPAAVVMERKSLLDGMDLFYLMFFKVIAA
jgi:hypothetical protein